MSNPMDVYGNVIWQGIDGVCKLGVDLWRKYEVGSNIRDNLKVFFKNAGMVVKGKDGRFENHPVIAKINQTDYGYHLILKLYPGLWLGNLIDKQPELSAALGGETQIYKKGEWIHVRVFTREIPSLFEYRPDLAGLIKKYPCAIPIGISRPGMITLPLFKDDTSALLIAGMPGSGKSVFLRQALTAVIMNYNPWEVQLYLVDMKMGIEFFPFQGAPHTADWAGDLAGAGRVLRRAQAEIERRAHLMKKKNVMEIQSYNQVSPHDKLPHIIVAIDEYAALDQACKDLVGELCRAGRFAGVHPIVCTQRPTTDVLTGTTKSLIPAALCFRMNSKLNSRLVLGEDHGQAAYITTQGRGVYRAGYLREVQVMHLSPERCLTMIQKRWPRPTPPVATNTDTSLATSW